MATYTDAHGNGLPRWLWPLLALIVAAGPLLATLSTPVGRVKTDSHAVDRHGEEAEAIRQCLERHGPDMVWSKKDDPGVYVFCVQLEDEPYCGKWGALFARLFPSLVEQCDYEELTSFVPRDGTYRRVVDYLTQFARRLK